MPLKSWATGSLRMALCARGQFSFGLWWRSTFLLWAPKRLPIKKNKFYEGIKEASKDKLFVAKFHLFKCVAIQLEPILTRYQTDQPMLPFIAGDLSDLIRSLMWCFIKSEVLQHVKTAEKLIRIDVIDKNNHCDHSKIVGFAAEKELKAVKKSERQILQFRMEYKDFLAHLLKKLLEKSPIRYPSLWISPAWIQEKWLQNKRTVARNSGRY